MKMKRTVKILTALIMIGTLSMCGLSPVFASGLQKDATVNSEGGQAEYSVARAGNTYGPYIFTSKKTYTLTGRYSKSTSSPSSAVFYMPRNNNKDLVQGTLYFIPISVSGGTSINLKYSNYSSDTYTMDLSSVPDGVYMVKLEGSAVGSSGTASVEVTL